MLGPELYDKCPSGAIPKPGKDAIVSFFHAQYFHGMSDSAESRVRALALLWNFCPSSPQTVRKHAGQAWPAERLSGKRYADNWLENLLVSGSMNGVEQDPQNPL
jgi:hypothetical protein